MFNASYLSQLSQDTIDLLNAIDDFQYPLLNPYYHTLGDLHATLDGVYIRNAGTRKHKVSITIGEIRSLLEQWQQHNQSIRDHNDRICQQLQGAEEEAERQQLRAQLIPDSEYKPTWILEDILNKHKGEPDHTVVEEEWEYRLGGYYSRTSTSPARGYIVLSPVGGGYRDMLSIATTYIHEMMHAYYDADLSTPMNDAEYAEEPLAEYGMLHFVEEFEQAHAQYAGILHYAVNKVHDKQSCLGVVHYGFGEYLYQYYPHIDWEYLMRGAHSRIRHTIAPYTDLYHYLQGVYPPLAQLPQVAQTLHDVLTMASGVGSQTISPLKAADTKTKTGRSSQVASPMPVANDEIVEHMLDMLPQQLFTSPDTVFLDPYYTNDRVVKAVIHRLYEGLRSVMPNDHDRFAHICSQQVYFIEGNQYHYFVNESADEIITNRLNSVPQVDVILGLPPFVYQLTLPQPRSVIIYPDYVVKAMHMAQHVVMLIPFAWTSASRFSGVEFRNDICDSQHLSKMIVYPEEYTINNLRVNKGVCAICIDNHYHGDTEVSVYNNGSLSHVGVYNIEDEYQTFGKLICEPVGRNVLLRMSSYPSMLGLVHHPIGRFVFGALRPFYAQTPTAGSIVVRNTGRGGTQYVDLSYIRRNVPLLAMYKVYLNSFTNKPIVLPPNEIAGDGCFMVGCYATLQEAENCAKYFQTKVIRFLIIAAKDTLSLSKQQFDFVPAADFTSGSCIHWVAPVSAIDQQLCTMYSISQDEWNYIDNTIH